MAVLSPQEEMMHLIIQCIENKDYKTASDCLSIYKNSFGMDTFFTSCDMLLDSTRQPLVSLICINCTDADIDTFLTSQSYCNFEIVQLTDTELKTEFASYLSAAQSEYLCFLEPGHTFDTMKTATMVSCLHDTPPINGVVCQRNFIDSEGRLLAHPDLAYHDTLNGKTLSGRLLLEYSIRENRNLYGCLSTLMVRTSYARELPALSTPAPVSLNKLSVLFRFLLYAHLGYLYDALVSTYLKPYEDSSVLHNNYKNYVYRLCQDGYISLPSDTDFFAPVLPEDFSVKRSITFFYTDKGEYYNLEPIAVEAKKRGFEVIFTEDIYQQAEIGIYCQHICHPENSKFSLILLHDLAQGHNRWPTFWELERWNIFDLGIVPGNTWGSLWEQSAFAYYANPRCGVFALGYPKSDLVTSDSLKERSAWLRDHLHLKYDFSILYAPSWENDGKEDEFVQALHSLPVNLLIKQANWSDKYADIIENIRQMRQLHEGRYDNVHYIEPEESIMTALSLCDMVVSDESSVMAEALMFGKPSVAVTDWLIPDTTPSRPASVPMDYVFKCYKSELRTYCENILHPSAPYWDVLEKGKSVFGNIGHSCNDIMDAIEYFTGNKKADCAFMKKKLSSKYTPCSMWN